MSEPRYVTRAEFEQEVLQAVLPVVVDFGAEWCHPCKQLDPVIAELAQEWAGKIKVVKIDSDKEVDVVTRYGIMGLPTLVLFNHGEPQDRLTGYKPRKHIQRMVAAYLE